MRQSLPAIWLTAWILVCVGGCHGGAAGNDKGPSQAAAHADPTAVRVTAARPQRKTLRLATVQPGQIEPFEQAKIYAKIAGYFEKVLVDIGDPVRGPQYNASGERTEKGQGMADLSVPELKQELRQKQAALSQADAKLAQAQAAVKVAKASTATVKAEARQVQAGAARAAADYQRWQSEHERMVKLAAKSAVTNKLVDETKNQLESADAARREVDAKIEAAQAAVAASEAQVEKAIADESAGQALREVALADQARTEALLEYVELRAPFDGTVTERNFDLGAFVQPGGGPQVRALFTVVRNDPVRVFVNVPELDAPLAERGTHASVRVQALSGREFTGEVSRTSWALDNETRTLRTEIDIPNPQGILRPGMYAQVTLVLAEHPNVLVVPATALLEADQQTWCFCVENGRTVRRRLVTGLKSGGEVEILSGLTGDEIVIQSKVAALAEGQPVEVVETVETAKRPS